MRSILFACCLFLAAHPAAAQPLNAHGSSSDWQGICKPFTYLGEGGSQQTFFCGFRFGSDRYITAKHCIEGWPVGHRVEMPGGHHAVVEWLPEGDDGVAILKLSRKVDPVGFLAKQFPDIGTEVCHVGWPLGRGLRANHGNIVADNGEYAEIKATLYSGYSGGPVCDSRGYIIGVNLATAGFSGTQPFVGENRGAYIATVRQIRRAFAEIGYDERADRKQTARKPDQRLIVLGASWCSACTQAKADLPDSPNVLYVDIEQHPQYREAYERATGERLDSLPTYWVEGTKHKRVGYQPRRSLLGWLVGTVKGLGELIFGSPRDYAPQQQAPSAPSPAMPEPPPAPQAQQPTPEQIEQYQRSVPPDAATPLDVTPRAAQAAEDIRRAMEASKPEPEPEPEPERDIDWQGLRVVIAASTEVPDALKLLEGPARRSVLGVSDGKAEVLVVAQRTHPEAFGEYVDAMGVEPDPLHLTVLVPRTSQGIVKGLVIAKVQRAIEEFRGHLPDGVKRIPIEVVFERLHGSDFRQLRAIAVEADAGREQSEGPTSEHGIIGLLIAQLMAYLGIHGRKAWLIRKAGKMVSKHVTTGGEK